MSTAPLVNKRRRDWFRVLRDLATVGVSMAHVARILGRSRDAVQDWSQGAEPKESDARVVLALYAKYCPAQYVAHQRQYAIRVELRALAAPGDQDGLPFVDVDGDA